MLISINLHAQQHDEQLRDTLENFQKVFKETPENYYSLEELQLDSDSIKQLTFSQNYKESYVGKRDFEYNQEQVNNKSLWDRFIEGLVDFLDWLFGDTQIPGFSFFGDIFRVVAIILIALFLAFIIRLLIKRDILSKWFVKNKAIEPEDFEQIKEIKHINFADWVKEAKRNNNSRLVIRFYYLWLLKNLSNKEIISWHPDKTNADYLREIDDINLKNQFEYSSYLYNNIWYGEHIIDDNEFVQAEHVFVEIIKTYES